MKSTARVTGLIMCRNAASRIGNTLAHMARICDAVLVVEDRSDDDTYRIVLGHPVVASVYRVPRTLGAGAWAVPEWRLITMLYRMAEFHLPTWLVMLDDDEHIHDPEGFRAALASLPSDVHAVRVPQCSAWSDPAYPRLWELMVGRPGSRIRAWRGFEAMETRKKWLHNGHAPVDLEGRGQTVVLNDFPCTHTGWDTLDRRIERVRFYSSIDPDCRWNDGVPYDKGLLFGYGLDQIDELIAEYRRRFQLAESSTSTS